MSNSRGCGLSHLSSGGVSGEYLWVNGNMNDWHKFGVDDVYMYGKSNNMAWVDITYMDQGTSKIHLYYNTSDPTAPAEKADKEADTVITCTNTGELKTARIPIVDANFSNYAGYDLVIRVDGSESELNGVSIKKVRVLGY